MESNKKLTKRQKKALAFRERKSHPNQEANDILDMEDSEVPAMEDKTMALSQGGERNVERLVEVAADASKEDHSTHRSQDKGKQKQMLEASEENGKNSSVGAKRKRDKESGNTQEAQETKRLKPDAEASIPDKSAQNQKFILFVGNLKYTTTKEAIQKHFSLCEPPPVVRLLTPKAISPNAKTTKSKGCAFLEFQNKASLQQALKLHHSSIDGRMINVELTAGGGGKSETRLKKLKERNKELLTQRQRKEEKMTVKKTSLAGTSQRYSTTSGMDGIPESKLTWSVGDIDDGSTHRGGRRHRTDGKKKRQSKAADWATGVNAIPVG